MKSYVKGVFIQMTAILLAALGAGAIAFFASIAEQTGVCEAGKISVQDTGLLGGALKGAHSAFQKISGTMSI